MTIGYRVVLWGIVGRGWKQENLVKTTADAQTAAAMALRATCSGANTTDTQPPRSWDGCGGLPGDGEGAPVRGSRLAWRIGQTSPAALYI